MSVNFANEGYFNSLSQITARCANHLQFTREISICGEAFDGIKFPIDIVH